MTKAKPIIVAGMITALSVTCLIPFTSSAETTGNELVVQTTKTDGTDPAESGKDTQEELNDTYTYFVNCDEDGLMSGYKVEMEGDPENPEITEFSMDYGELTEAEQKELDEIYDRIDQIILEAFPEDDTYISDEEVEKLLAPYEEEMNRLESRMEELEKKAGWTEADSALGFTINALGDEEFMSQMECLLPEEEEAEKQPEELDPDDGEASTEVSE